MGNAALQPIQPAAHVDLKRFCQKWYVQACTTVALDKDCVNATEEYELQVDGTTIKTTYTFFRKGEKEPHVMRPTGFVCTNYKSNAVWKMQFIWPFKAQYLIADVADDYSTCIVARDKRDLVWIMSNTPTLEKDKLDALVGKVRALGYPPSIVDKLYYVPQGV